MNDSLYEMIFKRKSFHLFRNIGNEHLNDDDLADIMRFFDTINPLVNDIKVKIKITKMINSKRGEEYAILFYSEVKDNYLQNIGYLGEQLDLYLVSKNIGTLWFGIGDAEEKDETLDFVIMMLISKVDTSDKFRKDMYKSKRKGLEEVWKGNEYLDIGDIVRFAPSACNTQPWLVETSIDQLKVYRYHKEGKRGIMPKHLVTYYNQIDMGIFLCFLELVLSKNKRLFSRELYIEDDINNEKNLTAIYKIMN